ncbi:TetR/AcrR family transcriptional regulator [Ideonella azotifigens]|uniref:TetR/AcrR family transcriptional regulator n=1 Tax=Ideonella azotifigens TaxID=513160 RepID=A0ABN1KFN7_9BURK|nr:TetR/AcrR family transcriptional regulator [Ideonella azotifigens]MCD2340511.1 TetR/AcrR family transcriptional regulator [Ideonella azotifigens]
MPAKARTQTDAGVQLPHQPKAGYHHGDLARALVVAATRLVEAGGGGRLTLRAAAQAAGVSVAAPYRHFADREALLAAVLAEGFGELARRTDAARLAAAEPLAALAATGLAYVQFAAAHPRTYRLMFGPECDKASHPALMQAGHAALGVLHRAVADCEAAGLLRKGANVQQVALAGWSLTHGLASLHVDGLLAGTSADQDIGATASALNAMLLAGVRRDA